MPVFIVKVKGGPGSGNFGHRGRSGKVGGSSSGVANWTHAGVHGTDHPDKVLKEGFSRGNTGILGTGVYIDTSPDRAGAKLYGSTVLGIRTKDGLNLFDASSGISSLFSEETDYGDSAKITEHLKSQGFDGVKAVGQTVIFDPENVEAYKLND